MKKFIFLAVFNIFSVFAWCQYPATSISQNFDGICSFSTSIPPSWSEYTPAHLGTYPLGSWSCSATHGRGGSGGMQCTDTFSNADHLDTSFLLTPLLNLSSYAPGHVFLQFDTKTTNLLLAGDLSILKTADSTNPGLGDSDLTPGMMPVFTNGDSSNWVTHVIDLTSLETIGNFYIAFMFTSTNSTGSIWFIDNVYTKTYNITLGVPIQNNDEIQLSVSGLCNNGQISFSYTTETAGNYKVALYDMMGREVYTEQLNAKIGTSNYQISGLNLAPGMYFLKMGNGRSFGVTKVMVN